MALVIQNAPAGNGSPLPVIQAVLQPFRATCSAYLAEPPIVKPKQLEKPLSFSRAGGDLFLEFNSAYTHVFQASQMVLNGVAIRSCAFAIKFAPEGECDWPCKPEAAITAKLTPSPTIQNWRAGDKLRYLQHEHDRYTLTLEPSAVPPGYELFMDGCEIESADPKNSPLFCESIDGAGTGSMSAVLHLRRDSRIKICLELQLLALKPHANIFECTQTLAGRLLSSVNETGDVILKTEAGTELPAHTVVLSDIPFFKARFGPDWRTEPVAGQRAVCLLPVEADEESLAVFRAYIYGEPHSLDGIKAHTVLQALFLLEKHVTFQCFAKT